MYVDRFEIMEKAHPRAKPIVAGWTSEELRKRESEEIANGGFAQGRMIEAPNFSERA